MFVECRSIELCEPVTVLWKVSGNPINDHAEIVLVAIVNEVHKVFGRAVTTGTGEVANRLITPASSERMLRNGHQLDMGKIQFLAVVD